MFGVIYSFKVKPGQDEAFKEAWRKVTEFIYQYENSLGSRLHYQEPGLYIAYANWPDEATWAGSGDNLPPEVKHWSAQMREVCEEIKTLRKLEVVDDLLQEKTYST